VESLMNLCRYEWNDEIAIGIYLNDAVLPLNSALDLADSDDVTTDQILDWLPGGKHHEVSGKIVSSLNDMSKEQRAEKIGNVTLRLAEGGGSGFAPSDEGDTARLLTPIAQPGKLLLLAGNYSKHIEEQGGRSEERDRTFPYLFMKPLTTITNPGDPVRIPECSPDNIDWELELGVIIGKECHGVPEAEALDYVAGYTVINDISDRGFRPNPQRVERPKDTFFDWQHGKWHDTFCPIGPCVRSADDLPDPQQLEMTLKVNGNLEQQGSTSQMIFSVAAIIAFISSITTLMPGDIISTGTPHGVGNAKGKSLKPGDTLEAEIKGIGTLRNPVA